MVAYWKEVNKGSTIQMKRMEKTHQQYSFFLAQSPRG